ncbi:MT-A70 family protein [Oxytricha trifallax]|uniref:mRNA m(6)A methyltransferase n=1 Tax=Oxytricha trifallax TaxID=1172189 RepID=A0A073HYS7_9SPIT|nr:MT-A70 family protein [Oxytricha trifallax]
MGKKLDYEHVDATELVKCSYCSKSQTQGNSLNSHLNQRHREENKQDKKDLYKSKRVCIYCLKEFTRSNDREKHEVKCQNNYRHDQIIKKRKDADEKMGIFRGPKIVTLKINKGHELIPDKQKAKNLTYKNLKNQVLYEGDVKNLRMWGQIEEDCHKANGRLYEVILMDPPWRLRQDLRYPTMSDQKILRMPVELIQERGLIITWIVNQKKELARQFLKQHGYSKVDQGEWIILTKNGVLYSGWGKYSQHCNESFVVGRKGDVKDIVQFHQAKTVFYDEVQSHSEKPSRIYDFIQTIAPDRLNIEIFPRKNNIRKGFTFLETT